MLTLNLCPKIKVTEKPLTNKPTGWQHLYLKWIHQLDSAKIDYGIKELSLFELEVFSTLGKSRSVRETARRMQLEPSHVSKILKRVESKLSQRLMERSPGGVVLNREGVAFDEIARKILRESEALMNSPAEDSEASKPRTAITIGSLSYISKTILAYGSDSLQAIDESFRFRILDMPPDGIISAAIKGAIDIALHTSQERWPKTWDTKVVGEIRWGLYARAGHPLGTYATEAEILRYPFVVPTYWDGETYTIGNDQCPIPWQQRRLGHETSTADTAAQIVRYSNQVAFLPDLLMRVSPSASELVELHVEKWKPMRRKLYLSMQADRFTKAYQTKLIHKIKILTS